MVTTPPPDNGGASVVDEALQPPRPLLEASEPKTPNPGRVDPGRVSSEHKLPYGQAQQVTTLSPPIGQFVINTILQIAAIGAAIAFGVYAVRSVTVGSDANSYAAKAVEQAVTANQLAILALCLSSGNQVRNVKPHPRSMARFH
jgi:hypothetical protein